MIFIKAIILLSILMLITAMFTYLERKILAAVQLRLGPNVVGYRGLLQPFADGIKLLCKQILFPKRVNKILFVAIPIWTLTCSLLIWMFIPFGVSEPLIQHDFSLMIILGLQALAAFGTCMAGLISQTYFSKLGALRNIAQTMSVKICVLLCFICLGLFFNTLDINQIAHADFSVWMLPIAFVYFCCCLAEDNRTPFDTLEAEQELVAGYHTEYSSILFGFFYISEYLNILLSSVMISLLFFGGYHFPFLPDSVVWLAIKTLLVASLVFLTRATLPRYTFRQIMRIFWRVLSPFVLAFLIAEIFFKVR